MPRVRFAILLAILSSATAASAEERITQTQVGPDTVVEIKQPDVKTRSKSYAAITFHPGDSVTVTAGGCVQTGGSGSTWKRYVNPSGPNSDKLYHGQIQIPGATLGLVRLSGIAGRTVSIPQGFSPLPGQGIHLTLGYEDDDYTDNGYDRPDNGTENQCAGARGGPAWLRLVIHPGGGGGKTSSAAPFDLTAKEADANGLPLNPRWGKQDDPHEPGLPGQALCGSPWKEPCTTQSPTIMDLPYPFEPLHPLNAFCTVSGPLGRHVNWGIATYSGAARWDEHSTGFRGDDDYNINVWREDQSAYTQENPDAVHTEFDSDETIDHFSSPWWSQFHDAVDHGSPNGMIDGKEIIEIGVIGLDCAHSCGSEIHPVLVLAIHVKDDPADDEWAIFARNSGDEGFCSHDSILAPELSRVYLTLPARDGAIGVVATGATAFEKTDDQIQLTTFPLGTASRPTGFVVQVDLGDPNRAPMVNGELHLQWTMGPRTGGLSSARVRMHLPATATARTAARNGRLSSPEPEELFAKAVAGLPESSRKKIEQLNSLKAAGPHWLPLRPTHLSSPPSDFQSRAASGGLRTGARKPALGRIEVVPNPRKKDYYEKLGPILREATPPPAPH
jgi:hypothetical protein